MLRGLRASMALLSLTPSWAQPHQPAPYDVAPRLFAHDLPELGLRRAPGTETFTVFAPTAQQIVSATAWC